ncbi:MAG: hypothetical protein GTN76_09050, partial [Candidatus Aenigmarchaeota archaeon]|nr:hypothetical protein [Candidatus Aenigmarchaeota archaeon]
MNTHFFSKALRIVLTISVTTFFLFPSTGVCGDDPTKRRYHLEDYFYDVDFCKSGAPTLIMTYMVNRVGVGIGTATRTYYRDESITEYCSVKMHQSEMHDGSIFRSIQWEFEIDPERGWFERGIERDFPVGEIQTHDNPLIARPYHVVHIGDMWGGATMGTSNDPPGSVYIRQFQFAVLGVEDLEVQGVQYTGCLKIVKNIVRDDSAALFTWECPG